jgi:RNA polymerase sigma-70 factor (ECF subfamily)
MTAVLVANNGLLSPSRDVAYAGCMNPAPDDAALMLRYRDGDVAAFETLYRRHNDALYRYLLRLSLNREAAEDLYQDVWAKIIGSRERYRPTAKFTTFLYRVAHNCFIDFLRRNKRHFAECNSDPDLVPAPVDDPATVAEKTQARARLIAALAELPAEQRDVFLLHEEAGLSLDEMARVTGCKRETVKSRLRYANRKLKSAMLLATGKANDPSVTAAAGTAGEML